MRVDAFGRPCHDIEYSMMNGEYQLPAGIKLYEKAKSGRNGVWFDIGCGTGDLSFHMATRNGPKPQWVYAIDMSKERICEASERLRIANRNRRAMGLPFLCLSFHVGTAENLLDVLRPIFATKGQTAVGVADSVIMNFVIERLPEPEQVLKQIWTVLKIGGVFAFSSMSSAHDHPERIMTELLAEEPYRAHPQAGLNKLYTREEMYSLVGSTHFSKGSLVEFPRKMDFFDYEAFMVFMHASTSGKSEDLVFRDEDMKLGFFRELEIRYKASVKGRWLSFDGVVLFGLFQKDSIRPICRELMETTCRLGAYSLYITFLIVHLSISIILLLCLPVILIDVRIRTSYIVELSRPSIH